MTPREICEKIVEAGDCRGVDCECINCPLNRRDWFDCISYGGKYGSAEAAKNWLDGHKEEEEMTEERIRQIAIEEAEVLLAKYGIGERKEKQTGMICSTCGKPCSATSAKMTSGDASQFDAVSSCCKAPIQQKITEEYYNPKPGEDPQLPPGTPCEVFYHGEWRDDYYLLGMLSNGKEYIMTTGFQCQQIRILLSDIQDRGEKMVGKMCIYSNNGIQWTEPNQCADYSVDKYRPAYGEYWYRHTRYYCDCWEV
jgi:hypothetical protein